MVDNDPIDKQTWIYEQSDRAIHSLSFNVLLSMSHNIISDTVTCIALFRHITVF